MHHMTPSSLVVLLVCVVARAGSHGQNAATEHTDGHELQIGEEHCPGCMNSLELLGKYDYTRLRNTNQQQELLQRSTRQTEDAYEPSYFVGDSVSAIPTPPTPSISKQTPLFILFFKKSTQKKLRITTS